MTKPLISIITPTYNRANFLTETIDSVLTQDYQNIEHLIIDDGSSDDTKELLKKYENNDKVRCFFQNNSGQSIARNKGLRESRGDFICFLDSVDYFLPGKLSKQIEAFQENPSVDIVYGDYIFIDADGNRLDQKNMTRYSGKITDQLLKDNCVSMNTTMVRKGLINSVGGFSEHIKFADDYDLWLRLSVDAQFLYLPEKLSAYRLMNNQISSNKRARFESNEETICRFFQNNSYLFPESVKKDALNHLYIRASRHFSNAGNFTLAQSYLIKAFKQKPASIRTLRTIIRYTIDLLSKKTR